MRLRINGQSLLLAEIHADFVVCVRAKDDRKPILHLQLLIPFRAINEIALRDDDLVSCRLSN